MKPKRKHLVIAVLLAAAIGTTAAAYHWYYQCCVWPTKIQRELFGRQIVDVNLLSDRTGNSTGYGEGMFRWKYRIDPARVDLREFCGATPVKACRFVRTKRLKDGVDLAATYANGMLTIEEWWM